MIEMRKDRFDACRHDTWSQLPSDRLVSSSVGGPAAAAVDQQTTQKVSTSCIHVEVHVVVIDAIRPQMLGLPA